MAEEWRAVIGYEGVYEVSSEGRVKRLSGFRNAGHGRMAKVSERIWPGYLDSQGYYSVNLGRARKTTVHRLVCEAFHGTAPQGKTQVAHYDGTKTNNRADNLRWADWLDNRADGKRLGEVKTDQHHPRAKLTTDDVRAIRARHETGDVSGRQIAREFGIAHEHARRIMRRQLWKNT